MKPIGSSLGAFMLLAFFLVLQGCAGGRSVALAPSAKVPSAMMVTPKSVSPGSIRIGPMPLTVGPPMASYRRPLSDIQQIGFTQIPGAAAYAAASPDGSLWVLASTPGADKTIYHYVSGTWTNVPGAAARLAVAPDNTVWALTSGGAIYHFSGNIWTPIAGGASDISIAPDASAYVIASGPGTDRGIYHFQNGVWTQLSGAGVRVVASNDTGSFSFGIAPGGFYVLNSLGSIYFFNPTTGYQQLPGASVQIAPTGSGGLFALGYPANAAGNLIYYNNLATGVFTQEPGAASEISTDGKTLYAVAPTGGIYSSPVSVIASAPVTGYLTATATGSSFAGIVNNISTSGTLVAISTTETIGISGVPLGNGSLQFSLGATALDSFRAPASTQRFSLSGPVAKTEPAQETPQQLAAMIAALPRAPASGRSTTAVRRTTSLGTTVASTASFWVNTFAIGTNGSSYVQVPATLQVATANGYIWFDNTLTLTPDQMNAIANDYENAYVSDTTHYGVTGYTAGAENNSQFATCNAVGTLTTTSAPLYLTPPDSKVNVFVINEANLGPGVGGYFSSVNYTPQAVWNCLIGHSATFTTVPRSNEAPMIIVGYETNNTASFETGEDLVRGTAHELQHLINFVNHAVLNNVGQNVGFEDTYINEGMSMLAQDLAVNRMYGISHDVDDALYHANEYTSHPQNFALTNFTGIDTDIGATTPSYNCSGCYGEAFLFQRYLYDRFGGDAYLHAMLGQKTGFAELQAVTGIAPSQLISDFAIAMAASGTGATTDPRFGFSSINLLAPQTDQNGVPHTVGGPAAAPLPASGTPFLGSFSYFTLAPAADGKIVSVKDVTGTLLLQAGIVQH